MLDTHCGFIGLGDQGAPIAERMIAGGYPMTVWARRSASLEPFSATSAVIADSIEALAVQSDHVGICVRGDDSVLEVCHSLLASMRAGSSIAIHSTTDPGTSRFLAAEASERGIALVDAPVSGGRPGAREGKLTVMVGGCEQAAFALRPIFETFASLIVHLGPVGSGQIAKLINNALLGANLGAAHTAVNAASELNLDRTALLALLAASSGDSFALASYARQADLVAFRRRLHLFEQIGVLGEVLGRETDAFQALYASAVSFFEDPSLSEAFPVAAQLRQVEDDRS